MKQQKNGLNAIYYYDLPSMVNEGQTITSIIQKAQAIVTARQTNAIPLQQAKENTLAGLEDLQSSLETIKESIGSYTEDDSKVKKITEEADKILRNIPLFKSSAEILCSRLSEGKIRIVSIGEKSQGKTLFTQILTGLPPTSKLLKVKAPNNINDCTGAVNTFYHKSGQELPLIMVEFLTVKEVVEYVKEAIKLIQGELEDKNWTLRGIDSIQDKNGLKTFLSDTNHQAKIANLVINPEVKSSLTQYFENGVGFVDLLGNPQKNVPENDIDEYNDMQHPSKHYLAVKRINVTLDLHREGLFQYFEVADTKGLSVASGAVANQKLIYDVINESDAVFSIARTGQQQNWKVYTQALGNNYRNNEVFRKKHFAIINVQEGLGMSSADEGVKWIDEQLLSDYCYVGRLKEDSKTDRSDSSVPKKEDGKNHCVPGNFVNTLIIHMLSKIADHITEIDNGRIKICQQSGNNIAESLSKLKELLGDIDFTPFDEEKLVKEKVRGFYKAAHEYIDLQKEEIRKEKEKKMDEDDNDSDNELYYRHVTDKSNENRFASVYEVLTGEHYPGKLPQLDDDDEDSRDEEIKKAVICLFQSEKIQSRIAENLNTDIFVGEYANELVWAFRHVILDPLFDREKQHPIACKKKEDYFKELWEIFKLGQISGENNKWDETYVNDNIHEMKLLNEVYKKGVFDSFEKSDGLLTPYSFLKEYFRLLSSLHDSDEEYVEKQNLDDELCLEAIENEIKKLSLRKKIIARIKNFPDAIDSYCTNIADAIGNFAGDVAKYGCQFYKDNIDFIATEEDKERLKKSRRWKDVDNCRSNIMQYKFENLPLISISNNE